MRNLEKPTQVAILIDHFGHPLRAYITQVSEILQQQTPNQIRLYADTIKYQTIPQVIPLRSPHRWQRGGDFLIRTATSPVAAWAWFWAARRLSVRQRLGVWANYAPLIRHHPRVIHLTTAQQFPFIEPFLETYDTRLVVSFRGRDALVLPILDGQWREALIRVFDRASYLHGLSEHIGNRLVELGAPAEKTVTVYQSVDSAFLTTEPERRTQTEAISILSVGRLIWQKGHVYALHAIKLLVDKGFQVRYRIAGDGPEHDHLSYWIKEYRLNDVVELLGEQPHEAIRTLLCHNDIFLHPSVSEGVPNAILEASASALPVIAAAIGGVPEVVRNDITGILVPPADPNALAQALKRLIEHPEQRQAMGRHGRSYIVEKFSRQREIDEWLSLYRSLL